MKPGPVLLVLAIGLVLGCAFGYFVLRQPGSDATYWVSKAKYDADSKALSDQVSAMLKANADSEKVIVSRDASLKLQDAQIADLKRIQAGQDAEGRDLKAENDRLRTNAQAAIDANPAIAALVRSFDLRCANYEKQVFNLRQTVADTEAARDLEHANFLDMKAQRDRIQHAFDDEHAQRLKCEGLLSHLETSCGGSKFWAFVGKYVPPLTFALGWVLKK